MVMQRKSRPAFALYVVWHPGFRGGRAIADGLRAHFGHELYRSVEEGHGVSVLERSAPSSDAPTPLPIDWDDVEFTAVVALIESTLVEDRAWAEYVQNIARSALARGLPVGFLPVAMDRRGLDLEVGQQAVRWYSWSMSHAQQMQRLHTDLTLEFCRMLRHRLDELLQRDKRDALGRYLTKIRVFISHSKHDGDGEPLAQDIRNWMHENSALDSFFDIHDIPAGMSFEQVLLHEVGAGAMLAVHSDSYSSREWCRREIIASKRRMVPMVVVDCVRDLDRRAMPYLGNVPIVRVPPGPSDQPERADRIGRVAGCLLGEVFRNWLWLCRVGTHLSDASGVLFSPRPPELIALASLPSAEEEAKRTIVYAEPLLGTDEERLFGEIAPDVRLRTLTEWLEERQ